MDAHILNYEPLHFIRNQSYQAKQMCENQNRRKAMENLWKIHSKVILNKAILNQTECSAKLRIFAKNIRFEATTSLR